jgi:hypothetical protein
MPAGAIPTIELQSNGKFVTGLVRHFAGRSGVDEPADAGKLKTANWGGSSACRA